MTGLLLASLYMAAVCLPCGGFGVIRKEPEVGIEGFARCLASLPNLITSKTTQLLQSTIDSNKFLKVLRSCGQNVVTTYPDSKVNKFGTIPWMRKGQKERPET